MRSREETDVYDLASEIDEDLSGSYSGEEFLQKAKRVFLEHGYFASEGQRRELEAYNQDFDLRSEHVECSAEVLEYDDGPGPINFESTDVRFVLEDGRRIESVSGLLYGEDTGPLELPEREFEGSRGVV